MILRKFIEIVATGCQILRLKCTKFNFGWGSLQRSPDPLAGFKGPTSKEREGRERKGGEGDGEGRGLDGREGKGGGEGGEGGEKGGDVKGPGKWSAPGPALALGGPG